MMYKILKAVSSALKAITCRSLATRNTVKLSYHIDDPDETAITDFSTSPPFLVIHGLFGAKLNWHTIAKTLASTGRKVITVDARNHGNSEHSTEMDYPLMSKDILRLMDELSLDSAILIGHSMGGKIAMTTALSQPDRVEALVVVDISPTDSPTGTRLLEYAQRMKDNKLEEGKTLWEVRNAVERDLRHIVESEMVRRFLVTNLVERDGKVVWRLNLDSIIANYSHIIEFPEFNVPFEKETIFIGGSLSHHISDKTKPKIERLFPKATIKHVLAAGHWVHSENESEFLRILMNFLNKIS